MSVQWNEVECAYHNGRLLGYIVQYVEEDSGFTQSISVYQSSERILGLSASTVYLVSVAAVNNVSVGVFSDTVRVKTLDSEYIVCDLSF